MKIGVTHRGQKFTISRRGLITGLNIAGERAWKSEIKKILREYKKWREKGEHAYRNYLEDAVYGSPSKYDAIFHKNRIDVGCCTFSTEDIEYISKLLKL